MATDFVRMEKELAKEHGPAQAKRIIERMKADNEGLAIVREREKKAGNKAAGRAKKAPAKKKK